MTTAKRNKPLKKAAKPEIKPDPNALTITDLVSDDHLYDEWTKVDFPDGRYTFVNKVFRPSTVDAMLEEFGQFVNEYESGDRKITEAKMIDYLHLHLLLWFSKICPDRSLPFDAKVDLFEKILNSRLAEKIMDSFDKNEIRFVYERLQKKLDAQLEMIKANDEVRQQVIDQVAKSDLTNKDLILQTIGSLDD